ncbi:MAG: preprotein translocase subunit SecE [Patescibacteria group bacterium]|nr:preprotein translocase subunit SecE [Patescibacteria group bacterium]
MIEISSDQLFPGLAKRSGAGKIKDIKDIQPQIYLYSNGLPFTCQLTFGKIKAITSAFGGSLFVMTTPVKFLLEVRDELKKVTWPTQNEVIRLTLVVIAISMLVGFFIGGFDFIFTKLMELIVK